MPAGIMLPSDRTADDLVDDILAKARMAADAGIRQLWAAVDPKLLPLGLAGSTPLPILGCRDGSACLTGNRRIG